MGRFSYKSGKTATTSKALCPPRYGSETPCYSVLTAKQTRAHFAACGPSRRLPPSAVTAAGNSARTSLARRLPYALLERAPEGTAESRQKSCRQVVFRLFCALCENRFDV